MPWLRNDRIRHSNPVELREYLALGLPVVSTDFPEAHYHLAWISIAADNAGFVARVRAALNDHDDVARARRRASVSGASWDDRARELMALCEAPGPLTPSFRSAGIEDLTVLTPATSGWSAPAAARPPAED